jgi:2-dehydro-3-deoxyglucarate aldolase
MTRTMTHTPYQPFPNSFKRQLLAGQRLVGCWCSLASPISTEVLGVAGFDWLLLDAEHAPNDAITLVPQLMALKDSRSAPVVRPSCNSTVEIKRLLDAGFYNFLIPMVQSAEDAASAVAATRYPPEGVRGVSVAQRSNRYGTVANYFQEINQHICVMVQIESPQGVAAADQIAATAGVDGVFVGPSDLAATYGHLGNASHPEVQAAIARILQACQLAGKPSGILAPVEADARRYMDMGATFVAVGSDLGALRNATQALKDRYIA